jgi:hypothetical protein
MSQNQPPARIIEASPWHPSIERLRSTLVAGSWALLEIARGAYADWKDQLPSPKEDLALRVEILAFFLHVSSRHAQRTGQVTRSEFLELLRPAMARDLIRAAWDSQPENPFQGQGIVQQWQVAQVMQQMREADATYAACREIAGQAINSTDHVVGRFVRRVFQALETLPSVEVARQMGHSTLDIITRIRLPALVQSAASRLNGHR